jgi:ribonuclease BN (tRNA processing enzyme)
MKLTVLGFWGGYPGVNGATSGYLLEKDGFHLLLDCGSAVLSKLQQHIRPPQLDAVVLSHYHHDHVADIGPLQYARLVNRFMGEKQNVLPIYGHSLDEAAFKRLTNAEDTKGVAYNPNEVLNVGPFSIQFLKTKHPVHCYAMRISDGTSSFVYTADSSYIEEFIPFSMNADLLICECNFYAAQDGSNAGHMNSLDAAKIAGGANVKQLLLTHLPHFGDHIQLVNEAKETYEGRVELAYEGWTWEKG